MRPSHSALLAFAAAAASAAVIAACGDTSKSTSPHSTMSGGGPHDEVSDVAPGSQRIEVTAANLEFDPDEITVTAGEDFAIVLTSHDLLHDFNVEGVEGHVSADTGDTVAGGFRVDEPGTYTFYCAVEGHREAGMEGTLVVEAT
ncbi:MAG: cupredoxin domain-containing protein [Actinomycetota bacterium]